MSLISLALEIRHLSAGNNTAIDNHPQGLPEKLPSFCFFLYRDYAGTQGSGEEIPMKEKKLSL